MEFLGLVVLGCLIWAGYAIWKASKEELARTPQRPAPASKHDAPIRTAIKQNRRLWLRYADAKGEISERMVTPAAWDGWMLEAYCHLRESPRNFRVDRIINLDVQ
ncbi:MAG: WYL domain-containing protein [Chloroflexota bacterium]|nr:WYL domain-containing protein [Chloroflexota bacterium]